MGVLVLAAVWALGLGSDTGPQSQKAPGGGHESRGPDDPITPGPTDSVPPVTERPGGRDDADSGAEGSGGGAGGSGEGSTGSSGSAGDSGSGGALPGSSGSLTGGDGIPATAGTPDCARGDVTVRFRSLQPTYRPDETPTLKLTLRNDGDRACRVDLGRTATVVTVTDADGQRVWSSADCPPSRAAAWVEVPAGGTSVHDLEWDRERSKPQCASPSGGKAPAGEYEIEAEVPGLTTKRTDLVLENA
ncbi:hypothetical protein [Streptomyces sp. TR06-5]|uniref:hypothetical protein n=1 Tax=Streptomyces sp. TR06-5 TaxID=3385976 RepID=UPI0039A060C7